MSARARIGVLALQGAFAAHTEVVRRLGREPREVRLPHDLDDCEALVMPGGESTTMSKLLETSQLFDPIAKRIADGMPVFGTCAGMILLASNVLDGRDDQRSFAAIDIDVRRNAYGRQVDSFETDLTLSGDAEPLHAVFIRAPRIERMGANVMALAEYDGAPVLVRSTSVMAASFHPELTDDDRVHRMFLELVDTVERR
ncbi:MAG: pyridoxal 5'-phosphate synthase glutaminase subunit PdxT [Ilumatobacteraceae bacterium]